MTKDGQNIEVTVCKNKNLEKEEGTTVKNLIGYEWKEASNGAKIEVVNPATQELIDTVPNVTEEDVDEAVKVAVVEQKNGKKYLFMKEQIFYINLLI